MYGLPDKLIRESINFVVQGLTGLILGQGKFLCDIQLTWTLSFMIILSLTTDSEIMWD